MPNIFQDISKKISDTITVDSDKKIQFRDTGNHIQSASDGKLTITADGTGADDITLAGTVTLNDNVVTAANKKITSSGLFLTAEALTTTATANANSSYITMDPSAQAASAATYNLRAPVPGQIVIATHIGTNGGTASLTTPSGTTFDGTSSSAEFNASEETLVLCGVSTTRWVILENIGSVNITG